MTLSNADLDDVVIENDAIEGDRIAAAVYHFLGRFVSYPSEHAHIAHTLWIIHTHLMHVWDSTPRIAFLSPEPASGKSRALEITELLVPNPVTSVNMTPSYLFRKVGSGEGATILYDEIDTVFGPRAKENEEIRGLLNAGHRRGATAARCVLRGRNVETEEIEAYAPVALAGLGWLPDTILSRSVIIRMRRRHAGEKVEPFRRRIHERAGLAVCQRIALWARGAEVNLPDEIHADIQDRDADVWEPLIAVADAIGGDWPHRARTAAVALVSQSKEREPSLGVRLLADLKGIFGGTQEMPTEAILRELHALKESPWNDLKGKPLNDRGLAQRLRQYEVKPRVLGGGAQRGYRLEDLRDAWERYLAPSPLADASVTSVTDQSVQPNDVTDVTDVTPVAGHGGQGDLRCHYCRLPATATDPLLEAYAGEGEPSLLHRACIAGQSAISTDNLEIPPFLDRRGGTAWGYETSEIAAPVKNEGAQMEAPHDRQA
jgi:Protein of unknown function (DUF3631)